jgi:hypothetical protein
VKVRGSKQWFDCITLHALRPPQPVRNASATVHQQLPAVVLMDCSGVGWGNRFRAFQVRAPAPSLM